jgi:hypothetical protein
VTIGTFLEECAVITGGLQSVGFELRADVFGGEIAAALAGAASFEQIARKKFYVCPNHLGIGRGD